MGIPRILLTPILISMLGAVALAGPKSDLLQPGTPVRSELGPGETRVFRLPAPTDHVLHVVVEQHGVDVVVQLFDPAGRMLDEAATPGVSRGPEHLVRITEDAGEYRLEVHSLVSTGKPGHIEARLERLAPAPESVFERIDLLFAPWNRPGSPGAALAVSRGGELVYAKGYGAAHLEYDAPITPDTVFHVASVSKQFAAFAAALLADRDLLSLDANITELLPGVPDLGAAITPRHLVHHTSGLRDQWELLVNAGWRIDDVITTEQIMRLVARQRELNFPPGEEHLYSNTGYTLLAQLVEQITGRTFRGWAHDEIFEPLGMASSHFHDDHREIVRLRAYSYAPRADGGFQASPLNYATVGATSLFTTAKDLVRWLDNLDRGTLGEAAVLETMHRRIRLNSGEQIDYAFGLVHGRHRGLATVGHGGADAGYRTHVVRYPDQGLGIVVLSNLASFSPRRLTEQVAEALLRGSFPEPPGLLCGEVLAELAVSQELLDRVTGVYRMGPGELLTASPLNGRLLVELTGRPRTLARPRGELAFALPTYDSTLEFEAKTGEPAHMATLGARSGERVARFTPAPENLKGYVGGYWSPELATSYQVVLEDGRLTACHSRHEDLPLTPTISDQFTSDSWRLRTVQFIRNEDGDVDGFLLTGRRIRDVRFVKTAGEK